MAHISSLGEDLVLQIFLRLASLATLVRAALTCRAWRRAVATSPDFRRRFRALHPAPPLLGIFLDNVDHDALYRPPCGPSFVPGGFRDWDLAGAVRGGDFFLTSLLERSTKSSCPYWNILDCCGGRVLVTDSQIYEGDITCIVLNPLMRRTAHEFRSVPWFRYPGSKQYHSHTSPRLICLDEEPPSSFRVVILAYSSCTLEPSVFSSDTGEWSDLPAVDVPARSHGSEDAGDASEKIWIPCGPKMHANGFVYWIYMWCGETEHGNVDVDVDGTLYLISLDTTTMEEFSFAELPPCLRITCAFHASETEDGAACIVYFDGSNKFGSNKFGVVKHTRGDDGVDRWIPDRVLRLEFDGELERLPLGNPYRRGELSVLAVSNGYVYFSTSDIPSAHDPGRGCSFFMSLCLATKKMEKLFESTCDKDAYAYIMPWPPCLLSGNYGQFAFEGAP